METSVFRCCLIFLISCSPFGSCSKNETIVQNRVANLPPITETGALQQLFTPPSFGGLDVDFYNIFTSFVNQTRSTLPLIAQHGNFSLIQLGLLGAVGAMATGLITIIAEAKYFKEQQEEMNLHKRIDVDLQNHLSQIPQTLKPYYAGNVPYKDNNNFVDNSQQFYGSDVQPSYSSNNYYSDSQSRKKRQVYTPKKNENSTTVVYPVRKRKMKKKITPPPQDFQVEQSYSYDLPLNDFNINETSQLGNSFPYYSMANDANSATTTTTTTTTTTAKPKSSKILTSVQNSGDEKDKDNNNSNNNNVFIGSQPQYPDNGYSPEDIYANYYQQLELEKQNYLNAQQYYQQEQQDYKTGSDQNAPVYKPSSSQKDTNTNYYAQQAATTTKKSVTPQILYPNPYTQNPLNENNYYANQEYPNKIYFRNESQSVPNWNSNNYMIQLYTTVRPSETQNSNTQTPQQFEQDYYQQVQQQQEAYQQNQQVIPDFPPQQPSQSQEFTQQRPSQGQYVQQSSQSQQQNAVYPQTQVPVQSQQQINAAYPQSQAPAQIYQQPPNAVHPQTQIPDQNFHQQSQVLNPQIQSQNLQQRPQVLNPQLHPQNPQQRPQVLNPQIQPQNPQQRPQVFNPQINSQNPQQRPQVLNPQIQPQNPQQPQINPQIQPQNPQQPQINPQIQNLQLQPQLASQGNGIQNSGPYIEEYLQEMHPPQLPQSNYIANNQQGPNRKNYYVPSPSPPPRSLYEQQPSRPVRFPYPQPNRNSNAQINPHNRFPQQNPYATNNPYGNVNPNNNQRVPHNDYVHPGRQDATTARSLLSKIFNPFALQFPSRNKNSNFMKRTFWTPDKS